MALGEVKINRGLFQIAVAQQHLDRAQVRTVFEQVSGESSAAKCASEVLSITSAVFPALSTLNVDDHTLTVDVADLQVR
jgi:hypothetical protein